MLAKTIGSFGLALTVIFAQAGAVLAAPLSQETTPLEGTVQGIVIQTDPTTGAQTGVLVTLLDSLGVTHDVVITLEEAAALGLISQDPTTGDWMVNAAAICPVGATDCVPIQILGAAAVTHPAALALAAFFGVTAEEIMAMHEEGVGFGVIAQALWLSNQLGGGSAMFGQIVDAKQTHDYSGIVLPDGSTPTNWGQFKKGLLEQGQNLGAVMSGHGEPPAQPTAVPTLAPPTTLQTTTTGVTTHGHKGGHGNGQARGHSK